MKTCPACNAALHKHPHESMTQWKRRKFCDRSCYDNWRTQRAKNTDSSAAPHCKRCGARIDRRPNENRRNWLQRKYCSHTCFQARGKTLPKNNHGAWPKKREKTPIPKKACAHCGADIAAVMIKNDQRVTAHAIKNRKYCSLACSAAAGNNLRSTKPDPTCNTCGAKIPRPTGMPDHRWRALRSCSEKCRRNAIRHGQKKPTWEQPTMPEAAEHWLRRAPAVGRAMWATCRPS